MNDARRWMRYLLPGAVGEGAFLVWIYFDLWACDGGCYADAPGIPATALVALFAAAVVPLGFVASLMARCWEWTWGRPNGRRWAPGITDRGLTALTFMPVWPVLAPPPNWEEGAEARIDAHLRTVVVRRHGEMVINRIDSLLDLRSSLSNCAASLFMALIAVVAAVAMSSATIRGDVNCSRVVVAAVAAGALAVGISICLVNQRRVTRITNAYLEIIM